MAEKLIGLHGRSSWSTGGMTRILEVGQRQITSDRAFQGQKGLDYNKHILDGRSANRDCIRRLARSFNSIFNLHGDRFRIRSALEAGAAFQRHPW